jgi:hypothetical protein
MFGFIPRTMTGDRLAAAHGDDFGVIQPWRIDGGRGKICGAATPDSAVDQDTIAVDGK